MRQNKIDTFQKSNTILIKLSSSSEFSTPAVNFGNVHPSDVLDMPVDPNEPTYCLCHQVSYGEMIGCDNTDVSLLSHPKSTSSQPLIYYCLHIDRYLFYFIISLYLFPCYKLKWRLNIQSQAVNPDCNIRFQQIPVHLY